MKVIINRDTSIAGKSVKGDAEKVHDLDDAVAIQLIGAGKASKAPAGTASKKKAAKK